MSIKILHPRNIALSAQKPAQLWNGVLRPGLLSINGYITGFGDGRGSLKRAEGDRRAHRSRRTAPAYHPVSKYSCFLFCFLDSVCMHEGGEGQRKREKGS